MNQVLKSKLPSKSFKINGDLKRLGIVAVALTEGLTFTSPNCNSSTWLNVLTPLSSFTIWANDGLVITKLPNKNDVESTFNILLFFIFIIPFLLERIEV